MTWETLDIGNGVERGIVADIDSHVVRSLSVLRFEFQVKGEHVPRCFFVPTETDKLVSFLFDKSLTCAIERGFRHKMGPAVDSALMGYSFYVSPSKTGTNITPEFVAAITRFT